MKINVKFFALYRQLTGVRETVVEVGDGATVAEVWHQAQTMYPRLQGMSDTLVATVNLEYKSLETRLQDGDEVAFIPPVSGGCQRIGSTD